MMRACLCALVSSRALASPHPYANKILIITIILVSNSPTFVKLLKVLVLVKETQLASSLQHFTRKSRCVLTSKFMASSCVRSHMVCMRECVDSRVVTPQPSTLSCPCMCLRLDSLAR